MTGKEIKAIRTKLGLTQKEFGKEIGVTWVTVFKWEYDKAKPHQIFQKKIDELKAKADSLNV